MAKPPSTLTHSYTPLPLSYKEGISSASYREKLLRSRDSGDGLPREHHSLRRLRIESAVIASATGSALVELGHTKVLCQVMAPIPSSSSLLPSSLQLSMDDGTLFCEVKYAPHFAFSAVHLTANSVSAVDQQGKLPSMFRHESDLSSKLSAAIAAVVPLGQYPKHAIVVQITILQDDGGVLPVCVTAASLALVDAAVEILDTVTCCSTAVLDGKLLADPNLDEEQAADALVTLAVLPNWKEVTLWEQSGRLSASNTNEAIERCRDGCRTLHKFVREHFAAR